MASTVYERGYRTEGRNWERRVCEGESERVLCKGGVRSFTKLVGKKVHSGLEGAHLSVASVPSTVTMGASLGLPQVQVVGEQETQWSLGRPSRWQLRPPHLPRLPHPRTPHHEIPMDRRSAVF